MSAIESRGDSTGGIVGLAADSNLVRCVVNSTRVKGNMDVGGVFGLTVRSNITRCFNRGYANDTSSTIVGGAFDHDGVVEKADFTTITQSGVDRRTTTSLWKARDIAGDFGSSSNTVTVGQVYVSA